VQNIVEGHRVFAQPKLCDQFSIVDVCWWDGWLRTTSLSPSLSLPSILRDQATIHVWAGASPARTPQLVGAAFVATTWTILASTPTTLSTICPATISSASNAGLAHIASHHSIIEVYRL
jgi:hypothetical protein